jgi:predicted unusual protein kinase regulating ubiquinone biosynthesis (AarF/ABC1/UbiB family)
MIQNNRNILESELNSKITELIINKKISKHFILTYKVIKCNILSNKKLPDIINNRTYIILLNELARGDLKHLCKQKDFLKNNELLYNVFAQIMLSILTFHNLGYIHRDCHWGNFLYHYNNNLTGYYHYNINGKNYYLKTSKYSMYIYDFGLCTTINRVDTYDIFDDYRRIMGPFVNQNISKDSWLADISAPINLPSDEFSIFVSDFKYKLKNIYKDNKYIYIKNTKFLNKLSEGIINELLQMPNNIFIDKKPLNAKIINNKPYYINNKIKIKL